MREHGPIRLPARSIIRVLCCTLLAARACAATIERVEFRGQPAFRLSDGKTEAVVVPELSARIMRYGAVGGQNWLWNSAQPAPAREWTNAGGDKCFIGPHSMWKLFSARIWPPPFPSWDGGPHQAEELSGARLRTTGPVWEGFGARIVREFSMNEAGELVIEQRIEKTTDSPVFAALWTVSQAVPPDAIFIPLNPASAYARGFHPFGKLPVTADVHRVSPALLCVKPTTGKSYKLGADASVAALAAVAEGTAWVQRAAMQPGEYPEGAEGAGFPVEFYNHGDGGAAQYVELELLSPLRPLKRGDDMTLSVRWSLHELAAKDAASTPAHAEIEALLNQAVSPVSMPSGRLPP